MRIAVYLLPRRAARTWEARVPGRYVKDILRSMSFTSLRRVTARAVGKRAGQVGPGPRRAGQPGAGQARRERPGPTGAGRARTGRPGRGWRDVYLASGARAVSSCGDFLAATALVLELQQRGAGGVAVAPPVLLVRWTGRLADRVDSRLLLVATGLAQAAVCVALAFASGPAEIIALVAVLAAGLAVTQPCLSALLPSMVPADDLPKAMALSQTAGYLGMMLAPALGGLLMGRFGLRVPLLADAGSYLAIAAAGRLIRTRRGVTNRSVKPAPDRMAVTTRAPEQRDWASEAVPEEGGAARPEGDMGGDGASRAERNIGGEGAGREARNEARNQATPGARDGGGARRGPRGGRAARRGTRPGTKRPLAPGTGGQYGGIRWCGRRWSWSARWWLRPAWSTWPRCSSSGTRCIPRPACTG